MWTSNRSGMGGAYFRQYQGDRCVEGEAAEVKAAARLGEGVTVYGDEAQRAGRETLCCEMEQDTRLVVQYCTPHACSFYIGRAVSKI
jgi:hypothetical protein